MPTYKAPERIGLVSDGLGNWALAHRDEADVAEHYVRIEALAAARRDALEEAAKIAEKQAWAHGGKHFDGPELNSSAIANAIRTLAGEATP